MPRHRASARGHGYAHGIEDLRPEVTRRGCSTEEWSSENYGVRSAFEGDIGTYPSIPLILKVLLILSHVSASTLFLQSTSTHLLHYGYALKRP
jgi:hypothetical protein